MNRMVYDWRDGSGLKIDAQAAGERLETLRLKHGGQIAPEVVVKDARSRRSPLHEGFEWDDEKAAHEHRLWQARHIVNSIVLVTGQGSAAQPLRAFVNVSSDAGRGYTSRAQALSDEELRDQLVQQAWKELLGWRNRYVDFPEFDAIVSVIRRQISRRAA